LLAGDGDVVALIKPQFEAGRGQTKKGVVRDDRVRRETARSILRFSVETGWRVLGLAQSPIQGAAGNIEYLAHLSLRRTESCEVDLLVNSLG
jgi:23S rRNA (cytidine1920-2'-O)/16S rRNA (cytidine1409-2'-O)-methyltransferase